MAEVLGAVTTATKFFFEVNLNSLQMLNALRNNLNFRSTRFPLIIGHSNVFTRNVHVKLDLFLRNILHFNNKVMANRNGACS